MSAVGLRNVNAVMLTIPITKTAMKSVATTVARSNRRSISVKGVVQHTWSRLEWGLSSLKSSLAELFPEYKTIRIDRDSTRRKGSLESALGAIRNGEVSDLNWYANVGKRASLP